MTAPQHPVPDIIQADALREREERLVAVLLVVLLGLVFWYPSGAHPLQALAADAGIWAVATGGLVAARRHAPARLRRGLISWTVAAGLAFAGWGAVRWSHLLVPAPGREWVVGLLLMGAGLIAGTSLAAWSRPGGMLLVHFRRGLALLGIIFALFAFHQYYVEYPRMLADMRAELRGPVSDLMTQSQIHALGLRRIGGRLGDPNLYACWLGVLAVFGAGCLGRGEGPGWKAIGGFSAVGCVGGLMLTGSRGGLLAMLLGATLTGLVLGCDLWPRRPRRIALLLLALATMTVVGEKEAGLVLLESPAIAQEEAETTRRAASAPDDANWLGRLRNVETVRERLYYWQIAWRVWQRHPVAGSGPGGYSLLYPTLKPPEARESRYAHNWFFEGLSELGLIGAALLVVFWGTLAGRLAGLFATAKGTATVPEAIWPLIALACLCLAGLVQFVMQWREFLILIGLLAGLTVGGGGKAGAIARGGTAREAGAWLLIMGIMVSALLMTPRLRVATKLEWLGRDAMEAGDRAAALEAFEAATKWLPDDASLWIQLAGAKSLAGEGSVSWPLLAKAADLNPYSASIRAAQAHWLLERGRLVEAVVEMDEAVERYPSSAEHRLDRAMMLLRAGRREEALADLRFIEENGIPLWEYQEPRFRELKAAAGERNVE